MPRRRGLEPLLGILAALLGIALVVAVLGLLGRSADGIPASGVAASGAVPGDAIAASVEHVIDGDTIVVRFAGGRERVRYVGLDAPEIAHPEDGTAAECGGEAARRANEDLVDGAQVRLQRDTSDRDRFGRLLRHVWVARGEGWVLVGLRLIAEGAAEARSYPPDTAYDAAFAAAERDARSAGAGIWGSC
jgi:micrococcal nuclease